MADIPAPTPAGPDRGGRRGHRPCDCHLRAYERGQHVLDPHTGRAPKGVLSVTITGPSLAVADAYATAAFAMGTDSPAWVARLRGYEGMVILASERVLTTPGFPKVAA